MNELMDGIEVAEVERTDVERTDVNIEVIKPKRGGIGKWILVLIGGVAALIFGGVMFHKKGKNQDFEDSFDEEDDDFDDEDFYDLEEDIPVSVADNEDVSEVQESPEEN